MSDYLSSWLLCVCVCVSTSHTYSMYIRNLIFEINTAWLTIHLPIVLSISQSVICLLCMPLLCSVCVCLSALLHYTLCVSGCMCLCISNCYLHSVIYRDSKDGTFFHLRLGLPASGVLPLLPPPHPPTHLPPLHNIPGLYTTYIGLFTEIVRTGLSSTWDWDCLHLVTEKVRFLLISCTKIHSEPRKQCKR